MSKEICNDFASSFKALHIRWNMHQAKEKQLGIRHDQGGYSQAAFCASGCMCKLFAINPEFGLAKLQDYMTFSNILLVFKACCAANITLQMYTGESVP